MKLSLSWIFDYIDAPCNLDDADHIIALFNAKVAEIDSSFRISFDLSHFFAGSIVHIDNSIEILLPELSKKVTLPKRTDLSSEQIDQFFIIKKEGETFRWATLPDFGCDKEGLLPAFDIPVNIVATGEWRKFIESNDVILEVDNKSITHRPDMWGHRGFAREIAAFLKVPLKNKDLFLKKQVLCEFEQKTKQTHTNPFSIENHAPDACHRFAGMYFSHIDNQPSNLFMASRLLKVGTKPISMLVDLSNYLMLDWSQPTHFYDADRIINKQIIIRMARHQEALTLLDNAKLELTEHDLIIADAEKPLCLAGVRGGLYDSVTPKTKALFLEAATFDAGTVRRSALRHKTRTDASARFEKTLDTNMPIEAIERFCKLCEIYNVKATPSDEIVSVGKGASPEVIEVTHTFLEARIGMPLTEHDVVDALTRLEFGVLKSINRNHEVTYLITIPTFRSSKDIKIKEDILEEVLRCWGFEKVKPVLAQLTRLPYSLESIFRLRKIKRFLSHGCGMIEQQNYAMLDERFLQQINMPQNSALTIVNPVSENYARMAPSLIPSLLKNIKDNHVNRNDLSFFECGRIWLNLNESLAEQKSVAGIFFKKHGTIDFYEIKQKLITLLDTINLNIEHVRFVKTAKTDTPWFGQYQTAEIFYENQPIGFAGKMDSMCIKKLDIDAPCDAFVFELNLDALLTMPAIKRQYKSISKFQESYIDISILAPYVLTTQDISASLLKVHELVKKVSIIDFFEKKEWTDVRSLTYRLWINHETRNLEKQDIDAVLEAAITQAKNLGVTVRMEK